MIKKSTLAGYDQLTALYTFLVVSIEPTLSLLRADLCYCISCWCLTCPGTVIIITYKEIVVQKFSKIIIIKQLFAL